MEPINPFQIYKSSAERTSLFRQILSQTSILSSEDQARVLATIVENQELLDDLTVKESKKLILLATGSNATPWSLLDFATDLMQKSSISAEREQQETPQSLVSPSTAMVSLTVSSTNISPNAQSTAECVSKLQNLSFLSSLSEPSCGVSAPNMSESVILHTVSNLSLPLPQSDKFRSRCAEPIFSAAPSIQFDSLFVDAPADHEEPVDASDGSGSPSIH
nr:uncharacterized protein LOC109181161 [Ipomoea trifida]